MDYEQLKKEIVAVVTERADWNDGFTSNAIGPVSLNSSLKVVGVAGELDLIQLVYDLQDHFNVDIDSVDAEKWETVGDIFEYIKVQPKATPYKEITSDEWDFEYTSPSTGTFRVKKKKEPGFFMSLLYATLLQFSFWSGALFLMFLDHLLLNKPYSIDNLNQDFITFAIFSLTLWQVKQWRK